MKKPLDKKLLPIVVLFAAVSLPALTYADTQPEQCKPTASEDNFNRAKAKLISLAQELTTDGYKYHPAYDTGPGITITVPGLAIAIISKDKGTCTRGFGVGDKHDPKPVDTDTVFQLASLSKPLSASIVSEFIRSCDPKKKLNWDSKILTLAPTFKLYESQSTREVTIRDMFSHRSGLPEHAGDLLEDYGYDRKYILDHLRYLKPVSRFRTENHYTNFGFTQGAIAAATACDSSWEDAAKEKFFNPLKMDSSSYKYTEFQTNDNKAVNHKLANSTNAPNLTVLDQHTQWMNPEHPRIPDAQSPAGGASASINDLVKWITWLQEKISDNEDQTTQPQIFIGKDNNSGTTNFYGLGWNITYAPNGTKILSHSGGFSKGASTNVTLIPKEDLAIIVLTNGAPIGVAEGLAQTFLHIASEQNISQNEEETWMKKNITTFTDLKKIGIKPLSDYRNLSSSPTPKKADSVYLGTYGGNDLIDKIEIRKAESGELQLLLGVAQINNLDKGTTPISNLHPLKHYDGNTFTYKTIGENAAGDAGVTFIMDTKDEKVIGVEIENFMQIGHGRFTRISP